MPECQRSRAPLRRGDADLKIAEGTDRIKRRSCYNTSRHHQAHEEGPSLSPQHLPAISRACNLHVNWYQSATCFSEEAEHVNGRGLRRRLRRTAFGLVEIEFAYQTRDEAA